MDAHEFVVPGRSEDQTANSSRFEIFFLDFFLSPSVFDVFELIDDLINEDE